MKITQIRITALILTHPRQGALHQQTPPCPYRKKGGGWPMGPISVQIWPLALLELEGSSGLGLAGCYCLSTACVLSGQEHPALKMFSSDREDGDATAPLPSFFSLFITASPQGGPVLKGNMAQSHRNALWKGVSKQHKSPTSREIGRREKGGFLIFFRKLINWC